MSEESDRREKFIEVARENYASDDLEIDDEPKTSEAENGMWVAAWVWVNKQEVDGEDDETAPS